MRSRKRSVRWPITSTGWSPRSSSPQRDQAAKELRAGKNTAAAKAVKSLRRPTVAAWAVNRLVRVDPDMLDEYLDVTRELDDAQRDALAGNKGDMRGVAARRQRLLDELVKRTTGILEASGRPSATHEDDIVRSLQAASDPELAQQLRAGRLASALEPVSALTGLTSWFEESGAMASASSREQQRNREQASRAADDELAEAERELRDAEADVDRLQGELQAAQRRVGKAKQQHDKRRKASEKARHALGDE